MDMVLWIYQTPGFIGADLPKSVNESKLAPVNAEGWQIYTFIFPDGGSASGSSARVEDSLCTFSIVYVLCLICELNFTICISCIASFALISALVYMYVSSPG